MGAVGGMGRRLVIIGEGDVQVLGVGVGVQVGAGGQCVPGRVERVACPAAEPCGCLLDPVAALVGLAGGQGREVDRGSLPPGLVGAPRR